MEGPGGRGSGSHASSLSLSLSMMMMVMMWIWRGGVGTVVGRQFGSCSSDHDFVVQYDLRLVGQQDLALERLEHLLPYLHI